MDFKKKMKMRLQLLLLNVKLNISPFVKKTTSKVTIMRPGLVLISLLHRMNLIFFIA